MRASGSRRAIAIRGTASAGCGRIGGSRQRPRLECIDAAVVAQPFRAAPRGVDENQCNHISTKARNHEITKKVAVGFVFSCFRGFGCFLWFDESNASLKSPFSD